MKALLPAVRVPAQDGGAERPADQEASKTNTASSDAEHRLVRKIDLFLLPCAFAMYLLSFASRASIGNLRGLGMARDLNMSHSDYSLTLFCFSLGYTLFELPTGLCLASTGRPSLLLPSMLFLSGLVYLSVWWIHTLEDLAVAQFFLGVTQSGFFGGLVLYLSEWYCVKEGEMGKRFAVVFAASLVAGSMNAVATSGVSKHLDGTWGSPGWKWYHFILGTVTCVVALVSALLLPDCPDNFAWLNEEEKTVAVERWRRGKGKDRTMGFKDAVKSAATDVKVLLLALAYIAIHIAGTISYFLPTLIVQLGFHNIEAQLWSAVPYLTAITCLGLTLWHSERRGGKAIHAGCAAILACLFAVILASGKLGAWPTFALLCAVSGAIWTAMPCFVIAMVIMLKDEPYAKRAVVSTFVVSCANVGILTGIFMWPTSRAPHFTPDWAIVGVVAGLHAAAIFTLRYLCSSRRSSSKGKAEQVEAAGQGTGDVHVPLVTLTTPPTPRTPRPDRARRPMAVARRSRDGFFVGPQPRPSDVSTTLAPRPSNGSQGPRPSVGSTPQSSLSLARVTGPITEHAMYDFF